MRKHWPWLLLILLAADAVAVRWWWLRRREVRTEQWILTAARRYQVDPALVKAVIWRESRFRPDVRGKAGELGLMQVGSLAAQEWAAAERIPQFHHEHLLDPASNVMAGTWYLSKLLRRYPRSDNPAAFALADYNAGRAHVLRWTQGDTLTNASAFLTAIDFPSTRAYINAVLERRDKYRTTFAP